MLRLLRPFLAGLAVALAVPVIGCTWATEMRLHGQLNQAESAFATGNYPLAATRYESLSERYPDGPMRETILMRQGIAYYTIQAYHEARDSFLRSLKAYPQGRYADDAAEYIKKIDVLMSHESPANQAALQAALEDLNSLQKLRSSHPTDPEVALAMGNLYYELGAYDEALRYYYEADSLGAAFEEQKLIRDRMILDDDGKPVPMTPAMIHQRKLAENPLVVYDTHDYKARDPGSDGLNYRQRFYVVTGRVRNQGGDIIHDAELEVRFLDAHHRVLDTRLVQVGTLGPGEIRTFRAQADSYDNLYNIDRYEIIARRWN